MKKFIIHFFPLICFLLIFISSLNSQPYDPNGWIQCEYSSSMFPQMNNLPGGQFYKPERTNKYPGTNSSSVLRILTVFVQFANDYTYANDVNWPAQQAPIFRDSLFANTRNNLYGNEWWNAYNENTETISDYYMEISRGNFHVLGKTVNIILPYDSSHYQYAGGLNELNSDIYNALYENATIDWPYFENWSYDNLLDNFVYGGNDYIIDMMYVVHRVWRNNIKQTDGVVGITEGSIARLYRSLQGDNHIMSNGYTICAYSGVYGSGVTFTTGQQQKVPQAPFSKNRFITTQAHEYGHYLGFNHKNYGIMMGGPSSFIITGPDARFSPWETQKLGYGKLKEVSFNQSNHLNDFSSRDNDSIMQVLKIPLYNSNYNPDYFLLAFRNKVSKYDRVMLGDTAKGDPYRIINQDYGKGLYIYHFNEHENINGCDLECADGLFNWESDGIFESDWGPQILPFFKPVSVNRIYNDESLGSMNYTDGKSVSGYYNNVLYTNWGGIGLKQLSFGLEGTDKIFTNIREKYTNRASLGDRWDAWRLEYNNIFSPYSSPSTINWMSETNSDRIYIYITGESSSGIDFYVYKPDANLTESQILAITPPSKPMGIKIEEYYPENDSSFCHPRVVWEHNIEPDMPDVNTGKLKYIVYKATQPNMTGIPGNYQVYAQVDILPADTACFIDYAVNEYDCANFDQPPYGTPYPIRYKVKAVDNTGMYSVYSDFVGTEGITNNGSKEGEAGDNFGINKDLKFNISQNYPNPFNPTTRFKYSVPFNGNVSIVLYDIAGREIQHLVNEYKNAGEYIIEFKAGNLSSGVYFYRIKAGNNIITKKMILLK